MELCLNFRPPSAPSPAGTSFSSDALWWLLISSLSPPIITPSSTVGVGPFFQFTQLSSGQRLSSIAALALYSMMFSKFSLISFRGSCAEPNCQKSSLGQPCWNTRCDIVWKLFCDFSWNPHKSTYKTIIIVSFFLLQKKVTAVGNESYFIWRSVEALKPTTRQIVSFVAFL